MHSEHAVPQESTPQPTPPHNPLAEFSANMRLYDSRASRIGGKREQLTTYSHEHVISGYTWSEGDKEWVTDSIILGLSKSGLRYVTEAENKVSPLARKELDLIVRSTLLNNCQGRPDTLFQVLDHMPGWHGSSHVQGISSPIPLYHQSGMFKDVFLFLGLVLRGKPLNNVREFPLAIKIGKRPGSITANELDFHERIRQVQNPHAHRISHLLHKLNLDDFPVLQRPGQVLTIEKFEPGPMVGYYRQQGLFTAAAVSVTRCCLELAELGVKAGLGAWNWGSQGADGPILQVRFPSDINPGNFIVRGGNRSILVDPGEYHPRHTFSDIMLRLIANYWEFESPKLGQEGGRLLPLTPLFQEVVKHFGVERSAHLLRELRVTLGFFLGTPATKLEERFPKSTVRGIGLYLRGIYGSDEGIDRYISTVVRALRSRYPGQIAQLALNNSEHSEKLRFSTKALPCILFTDRKLRTIAGELDLFLSGGCSIKAPTPETTKERFCRSIGTSKVGTALRKDLPLANAASTIHDRPGGELVRQALYVTPFPDPAIVRIAMITAEFRKHKPRLIKTHQDWLHYEEIVISVSAFLHHMFQDRKFTRSAAEFLHGGIGSGFVKAAEATHRMKGAAGKEAYIDLMKRWLSMLTMLEVEYYRKGGEAGTKSAKEIFSEIGSAQLFVANDEDNTAVEVVQNPNTSHTLTFHIGAWARRVIAERAPELAQILSLKNPPKVVSSLPPFVLLEPSNDEKRPDKPEPDGFIEESAQ